ncbi:MAG: hypothetical protein JXQ29_05360 [Planctomycetes bacterium]|nr:hypothetical protein [Planctomycetota bacterium]
MKPRHPTDGGVTLLEVIFSIAIFSLVAVAAADHIGLSWSYTAMTRDRIFAYRTAQSILAELQACVDRGDAEVAADLDRFDDGVTVQDTLTLTQSGGALVPPDHPASQNSTTEGGRWRWARQISVRPFPGQQTRDVRFVTVRVFRRNRDGSRARLAETSSVIRSLGHSYPTTQVYDVYLLALENVPGWWVYMDSIRPFVESTLTDLESRNPGLKFRTHWITRAGYGRDPFYAPFMNDATSSTDPVDAVYFYPGRMPDGSAAVRYYVPEEVKALKNVDGVFRNSISECPFPYTLADHFNHCLRWPEAAALFQQRTAVGLEDAQQPTWQLLLEDLISHPDRFHNAILVNLHGELLPMPALRNYSDPAKDPVGHPGVRVVAHPENLRYDLASGPDVKVRVYSYREPGATASTELETVTVRLEGLVLPDEPTLIAQLTDSDPARRPVLIEKIEALATRSGGPRSYVRGAVRPGDVPAASSISGQRMYVSSVAREGDALVLKLRRSPLTCPVESNGSGLAAQWQLYGREYVPTPLGAGASFSQDLTATTNAPKNTARWVITVRRDPAGGVASYLPPPDGGNRLITAVTHLGDTPGQRFPKLAGWSALAPALLGNARWTDVPPIDPTQPENWEAGALWQPEDEPGRRWPAVTPSYIVSPTNQSRTFAYWTASAEDVPFTERYQFLGDPRHCPYADLKEGGAHFPNGFNWFFDNLSSSAGNFSSVWGFTSGRLRDGWLGRLEIDVPRFLQTVRTALTRAEALYTTLTGFSYYYLGIGNEIGYDASNGFPSSIPVHGRPYGTSGTVRVDSISGGGDAAYRNVKLIREAGTTSYWWGAHWLGELYPDAAYATHWRTTGNLPAGTAAGQFFRDRRQDITRWLPQGTTFVAGSRVTSAEGCTSFFNVGTASATFHHRHADTTQGTLTTVGQELAGNYNFSLPTRTKISRPFHIATDRDGGVGPEFTYTADYPRFNAALVRTYYNHDLRTVVGSALVELRPPDRDRSAYVVVNGIDRTTESGSAFVSKYSMLTLIHSLLEAGSASLARPIVRLPRAIIRNPTAVTELVDPETIPIHWETLWSRWDGRPYSATSTPNSGETETRLRYALLYSRDNGATWLHVLDDSPAVPGQLPPPGLVVPDRGTGPEQLEWSTPGARFPEGSYLLRVEVYRSTENLHYAYHIEKIYIDRS